MDHIEKSLHRRDKETLLTTALRSIEHGLNNQRPWSTDEHQYTSILNENHATFVTLKINQQLRGCIGTLEARRPLIDDVSHNAFSAAFHDPRFSPVSYSELGTLTIHISILGKKTPMAFTTQDDVIGQLRPGIDGLVVEEGMRRATFLPAVWDSLPEKKEFLRQLKRKAGFDENYWSSELQIYRYQVYSLCNKDLPDTDESAL